jgi:hypothetical protein
MRSITLGMMVLLAIASVACGIEITLNSPPTTQLQVEAQPAIETGISGAVALPLETVSPIGDRVKVPLIALEDYGASGSLVGCCDSLVWIDQPYTAGEDPLVAAYLTLLAIHDIYYGGSGFYNPLYQSDLHLVSAGLVDGVASVYLEGNLLMGGELDTPRLQAQLEQTALQFSEVTNVQVFINGIPLAEALSLR